jgi:Dockerin type I domain
VNDDGKVDIADALLVAQYDAGLRTCGQSPFGRAQRCDVNHDGLCDIGDALALAQCDAGLIGCSFSCTPFACP